MRTKSTKSTAVTKAAKSSTTTKKSAASQVKMPYLKTLAHQLASDLGLHCTQTKHFKKRFDGLDLRFKRDWQVLIGRLQAMKNGALVQHLQATAPTTVVAAA